MKARNTKCKRRSIQDGLISLKQNTNVYIGLDVLS